MKIIGLLDCNNFYASCERVFNPALRQRPIAVLSNNDGCVIARSNEAKKLGIKMGEPVFKCQDLIRRYKVHTCSANFTLYSDFSQRVMATIEEEVEELEVYSIDEAFLILGDTEHDAPAAILERASDLRNKVEKYTGISVSIGIATNKTLAKLANRIAKVNGSGLHSLYFDQADQALVQASLDAELADFPVADIWGIGHGYHQLLTRNGIYTALDLKYSNQAWVRQEMKINGLRLVLELGGKYCIPINDYSEEASSHSIISSRTFGHRVSDLGSLEEALANFTATAAYKLRSKKLLAREIEVYLGETSDKAWRGSRASSSIRLPVATASSSRLISAAHEALKEIFEDGNIYRNAGVVLTRLVGREAVQLPLIASEEGFLKVEKNHEQVSKLVDRLNGALGVNTLFWASMGTQTRMKKAAWKPQQDSRSPCYTTDWNELPRVR